MGQEDNGKNGLVEGMTTNPHSFAATILSDQWMKKYKSIGKKRSKSFILCLRAVRECRVWMSKEGVGRADCVDKDVRI